MVWFWKRRLRGSRFFPQSARQSRHAARAIDYKPLTVVVFDPGGHLIVLKREDNSGILRPQIAYAKAWGVLGMGHGGRLLAERAAAAPAFFASLADISGGRIAPVPGGLLVRDGHDNLPGAVGISGDTSDGSRPRPPRSSEYLVTQ
jgi:uncharacterized protein GlcG (DUF336 family)